MSITDLRSINTLEELELQNEKELFYSADPKKGKKWEERVSVNHLDKDGKIRKIAPCEHINILMQFGHGAFMYFKFLKYTAFMLGFACVISLGPIILNYTGNGLESKANFMTATTIGNLNIFYLDQGAISAVSQDAGFIKEKKLEYESYLNIFILYDFFICLIFIGYYNWILKHFKKYADIVELKSLTAADYTLEIKGLPEKVIPKYKLKDFFQKAYGKEVVHIGYAYKFNNTIENYKNLGDLQVKLKIVEVKYAKNKEKLREEKDKIYEEIEKQEKILKEKRSLKKGDKINYRKITTLKGLPVLKAFVTFDDPNAPELVKRINDRYRRKVCCCGRGEIPKKFLFEGEHDIDMENPDHPINIKWENLEYTKCQRRLRTVLVFLITIVMILVCFVIILSLNVITKKPKDENDCSNIIITKEDIDATPTDDPNYSLFTTCYCKLQPYQDLLQTSEGDICRDYANYLLKSYGYSFLSSIVIFITNYILKLILKKLSEFQKYPNETLEASSNSLKELVTIYCNTVLVTVFSTANIFGFQPAIIISNLVNLDTSNLVLYNDFYRDWYADTGFKIMSTMLIACFSPHVNNVLLQPVYRCLRRRKIKKAKLQIEMNKAVEPYRFNISSCYALALNVFFVCWTFCGGMPILLWFNFFAFVLIYWCNKRMFVKWTKKPPFWSVQLVKDILATLPYALILHICVSIWTFGNQEIFIHLQDGNIVENLEKSISSNSDFNNSATKKFSNATLHTLLLVVILGYYFVTRILFGALGLVFCSCKKSKVEAEGEVNTGKVSAFQGGFKQNEARMRHLNSAIYDMRENPRYKSIILLLEQKKRTHVQLPNGNSLKESYIELAHDRGLERAEDSNSNDTIKRSSGRINVIEHDGGKGETSVRKSARNQRWKMKEESLPKLNKNGSSLFADIS